jgi:hypothetical protein
VRVPGVGLGRTRERGAEGSAGRLAGRIVGHLFGHRRGGGDDLGVPLRGVPGLRAERRGHAPGVRDGVDGCMRATTVSGSRVSDERAGFVAALDRLADAVRER